MDYNLLMSFIQANGIVRLGSYEYVINHECELILRYSKDLGKSYVHDCSYDFITLSDLVTETYVYSCSSEMCKALLFLVNRIEDLDISLKNITVLHGYKDGYYSIRIFGIHTNPIVVSFGNDCVLCNIDVTSNIKDVIITLYEIFRTCNVTPFTNKDFVSARQRLLNPNVFKRVNNSLRSKIGKSSVNVEEDVIYFKKSTDVSYFDCNGNWSCSDDIVSMFETGVLSF